MKPSHPLFLTLATHLWSRALLWTATLSVISVFPFDADWRDFVLSETDTLISHLQRPYVLFGLGALLVSFLSAPLIAQLEIRALHQPPIQEPPGKSFSRWRYLSSWAIALIAQPIIALLAIGLIYFLTHAIDTSHFWPSGYPALISIGIVISFMGSAFFFGRLSVDAFLVSRVRGWPLSTSLRGAMFRNTVLQLPKRAYLFLLLLIRPLYALSFAFLTNAWLDTPRSPLYLAPLALTIESAALAAHLAKVYAYSKWKEKPGAMIRS